MYTYKLHKSNATPVLSSRAHLGAHKRAAPFRSMFSCKGEEGNIGMLVWGGGRQGGEEGGGRGGGRWGGFWCFSSHRQPKSIGGGETLPPGPWGSFVGSHRGTPSPPP